MGNVGTLSLSLHNVEGDPIPEGDAILKFFRALDNRQISDAITIHLPADPINLELPAFPQESNLKAEVQVSRFRFLTTGFFTLHTNAPLPLPVIMLRDPDEWHARFALWKDLPESFSGLKQILGASPNVELLNPLTPIGSFAGDAFDDVDEEHIILAKTALLNLYVALTKFQEP